MLCGHSIGGSRKLNGHWQSAGGLWGTWIDDTINYRHGSDSQGRYVKTHITPSDHNFIKNAPIPPGLSYMGSSTFSTIDLVTWYRIKVTADYNTSFIAFPDTMLASDSNIPQELQGKNVITPLYRTSGSSAELLDCTATDNGYMEIGWTLYHSYGTISKRQSYTPGRLRFDILSFPNRELDVYFLGNSIECYIPLESTRQYSNALLESITLPALLESQGTNSASEFRLRIQVKIVNWNEVLNEGLFYDTQ